MFNIHFHWLKTNLLVSLCTIDPHPQHNPRRFQVANRSCWSTSSDLASQPVRRKHDNYGMMMMMTMTMTMIKIFHNSSISKYQISIDILWYLLQNPSKILRF
jgi:hypothetical protein